MVTPRVFGKVLAVLAAAALVMSPLRSMAQTYPNKPIRMIVPFAPGGAVDFAGRLAGAKLSAALGQQIVIDNRPGAGGNIGIDAAAKAPADGYNLLTAANFLTINPSLYGNVNYDPVKDFEPVSLLTSYMLYVAVHPSFPARSIKELIALAKAHPGTINFGSSGIGTTTHIAGELFNHMAGVKLVHVPYKSSGSNMISDSLAGVFQVQFNSPAIVPFIKSGKLVLIGVTGPRRSPLFPDVPTVAESVPGYEAAGWNAVFAPAGTPRDIVQRLNAEIVKGFKQQDAIDALAKLGLNPTTSTPQELAALVKSEMPKWARVIKDAGIRPE